MDPFDTQMPLLGAMGEPGGYEYDEPEMDVDAEREKLKRQLAMQLMQDQLASAGPKAHAAALNRERSPVFGQHGPALGQDGDGLTPMVDRSLVAEAMQKQALGDSLTLNPGMKRFLKGGGGGTAEPTRPDLDMSMAFARNGAYKEGTLPSGTQVSHMPDGSIALRGQKLEGMPDNDGIQLADMTPEQRAEQEFDRKVMADVSRQKQAERMKAEGLRKGKVQSQINQSYGQRGGGNLGPVTDQFTLATQLLNTGDPRVLPVVGKMMEGMSQKEVAQLQADAAASLKKAEWERQSTEKDKDRTHDLSLEGQRQANAAGLQKDRFGHEAGMSKAEIAAANQRHQDTMGIEREKIEAQNNPKRQALGASINSDGSISPQEAEDFLTGKEGETNSTKLNIQAQPATDERVRAALSTIRAKGETAYDSPEEQEALRQELLRQGITPDDLRRFQGGDYGDPSWYEWWDRGVAPYLSSGSSALIDERHANTPLLQALIGGR